MFNPEPRFAMPQAIKKLAKELGLPYSPIMQDWSYEVSNPNDIEKYINHYNSLTDDDEKFVLIEIIIDSNNDLEDHAQLEFYWNKVRQLLIKDFAIHEYTIFYWAGITKREDLDEWPIVPCMQTLLKELNKVE
ncbi:MAG: hypothetical protein JST50_17000 [Bacteroidetes bacterium]|jgi:hypothetical protein|nr:hypothetical protein [Bacteroidota bacterium]